MANTTASPNMNLPVPNVGTDPGPQFAFDVNNCLTVIDGHNHSPGYGVQINPNGLNINSDLPFGGNNATLVRSVRFQPQGSTPISDPTDIGCVYEAGSGGDLWYNDASGNQIQITKSGGVNATSSGISSGTASASFVAGVLVVDAAALTPANIQVASVLLGNNTAGTNFLTLQPPSAMGASYTLTLPTIPSVLSSMTLDASGNMGSITFDQVGENMTSVGADAIGVSMDATGADAVANTRTRTVTVGSAAPVGGVAISGSSGFNVYTNTAYAGISNQIVTLTTSGRPVVVMMVPDGTSNSNGSNGNFGPSSSAATIIDLAINNNTAGGTVGVFSMDLSTGNGPRIPSALTVLDTAVNGAPGTYLWEAFIRTNGNGAAVQNVVLVCYEI